jgi:hypothetical protein
MTTQIKERIEGHYEVEEVPYGKVYKWVPVKGQEGKPLAEDETYYPEHVAYEEWLREEEAHPYLKHYEWLELQGLVGG